ncbi:MAG: phosphoenolpyruvate--protein phosphotransferase [Myxococcales bacterium]|nr:phosphoenolpyruvate--protein phosphotransferase [Myxococcales bacterium]
MSDGAESGPGAPAQPRLVREGVPASSGIGIGRAYVVDRRRVHVPRTRIDKEAIEAEIGRFLEALRDTRQEIEVIKTRLPHGEHRAILKAQQMMLRDPDLIGRVEQLIAEELRCAEWALATATDEIHDMLDQADDEYFRERSSDITFLSEQVILALLGDNPEEITPPAGSVVVAYDLSPAETVQLHRCAVAGIVTAAGGKTSHSAIMARSLQIPAVVGVAGILGEVMSGEVVVVDGVRGAVIVRPDVDELGGHELERDEYNAFEQRIQREHAFPAITVDGRRVMTRANLSLSEDIDLGRRYGAEGIGLYRSEYMFMNRDALPTEEEHYLTAKTVIRRYSPYPVVFRTFDLGSDKPSKLLSFAKAEANPAMGLRSLRLALREREIFLAQLRGLLRASLHGPLHIMLPLVGSVEELEDGIAAVEEARDQLEAAGMAYASDFSLGVMIETPSAALIADLLASRVDFMSIGTNDLIQYTLAVDRDNDDVDYLYQPLHPAILRLIRSVAAAGAAHDVPVSLCGEMAADPRYTWVLVGLGIKELSMSPSALPVIKHIIRQSSAAEMDALTAAVLEARTAREADEIVLEVMRERFPEHLKHGGGRSALVEEDDG